MTNNVNARKQSIQGQWSSRWVFILATTGAAVGLGNIWKFPYITGINGGGSFVLLYLICIFLIGFPLMIAELTIGKLAHRNPVGATRELALISNRKPMWRWIGVLCILSGVVLLSYYSIIAGWGLRYIFEAGLGHFSQADAATIDNIFTSFLANPASLMFWQLIIMLATTIIVMFGIKKGLERAVLYLFPSMVVILIMLVIYPIVTVPEHFNQAVEFLFKPDFSAITAQTVLVALGHSFFTLSLAIGSVMAYGAYVGRNISIPQASFFIVAGDTIIALLVGLAIFPIVFAHGLEPDVGPGLLFQTLPISFGDMPFGSFFAVLFFVMIVCAALATTISLIEPAVSWLVEEFNIKRKVAAVIAGTSIWLFGLISLFSLNIWSEYTVYGLNFFDLIDFINANIMLPVGGLLIAIFTVWVLKRDILVEALGFKNQGIWYYSFIFLLGILAPIAIIAIFLSVLGII